MRRVLPPGPTSRTREGGSHAPVTCAVTLPAVLLCDPVRLHEISGRRLPAPNTRRPVHRPGCRGARCARWDRCDRRGERRRAVVGSRWGSRARSIACGHRDRERRAHPDRPHRDRDRRHRVIRIRVGRSADPSGRPVRQRGRPDAGNGAVDRLLGAATAGAHPDRRRASRRLGRAATVLAQRQLRAGGVLAGRGDAVHAPVPTRPGSHVVPRDRLVPGVGPALGVDRPGQAAGREHDGHAAGAGRVARRGVPLHAVHEPTPLVPR